MAERLKKKKWLLPVVCYSLFIFLWLATGLWHFVGDRMRPQLLLDPGEAALTDLAGETAGIYQSQSVDPQMVWTGVDSKVRLVALEASFGLEPGEVELFYTRRGGQGFSARMREVAAPQQDGSWLFRLPAGRIVDLRIDPGAVNQNTVEITAVVLNPRRPAGAYFVPSLRDVLAGLLLPALACCVIYTIIEWIDTIKKGRRKHGGHKAES